MIMVSKANSVLWSLLTGTMRQMVPIYMVRVAALADLTIKMKFYSRIFKGADEILSFRHGRS